MDDIPALKLTPTTNDQMAQSVPPGTVPFKGYGEHMAPGTVVFLPQTPNRDPLRAEKVAIIGTAPSSRGFAPYQDPNWAIWGSSPGNMSGVLPRVDAWFEMHCNFLWPENKHYGEPYVKWLNEQTFPVVAQDQKLIPRAISYPKDEMIKKFGPWFFTSSFAWMMAFAIDRGVKELGLFGVDMASKDEYILQRAGGHYFMQLAKDRGIKVIIPDESDLKQHPPLYGYADATPWGRKLAMRRMELSGRLQQLNAQAQQTAMAQQYLAGAMEDLDYHVSIWGSVDDPIGDHNA